MAQGIDLAGIPWRLCTGLILGAGHFTTVRQCTGPILGPYGNRNIHHRHARLAGESLTVL